jgi:hypothetical protein
MSKLSKKLAAKRQLNSFACAQASQHATLGETKLALFSQKTMKRYAARRNDSTAK